MKPVKRLRILTILLLVFVIGCATANIETVGKSPANPASCKASYTSFGKDLSGIKMSACHATGEAEGSGVNNALTDALLNAMIKGLQR